MKITLKKLHIENFKNVKDQTFELDHITKIKGQNASGKTTIVDAFMWCLFNKDSKGNTDFGIRPLDAAGNKVDHVEIKVDLLLDVDGREYQITKVQKQNWVKKRGNLEATLQGNVNSYEIDGVPKKEKDFKAFVSEIIDEDLFQLLTNPSTFVNMKWKDQRTELLKMVPEVNNDMVIASNPDTFSELNLALSLHTPEDLQAKSKKALSEYKKKQFEIPARIDEVKKSMTDIDVAELELQRNSLKEQIAVVEKSEEDMTTQYEQYQKETDDLMNMKFKLSDIERKANEGNLSKKKGYEEDLAALERDISSCEQKILLAERDIKETKATQSAYEKKRDQVFDEWKEESAKIYVDTLEFDENSIICPVCGRAFQEEKIEQIKADFEKSKADKKAKWLKDHEEALEQIKQRGTMYKGTIVLCQDKVKEAEERIKAEQENLNSATVEKEKIEKLINELPEKVDISSDKEYQSLKAQIESKEEYLSKMNSGAELRQQLKIKKHGLTDELAIVEKQIASADNSAKEERIEELETEMREIAQSAADEEKMLYMLEQFMKAKMQIIEKMINEKFEEVNWKLFKKQENGAIVECCECTYKGVGINKDLNNGHKIVSGLDIIRTLSKMHDVYAPIFVDNAEAVNDFNYPSMETQMILLKVSDDKELRVESEE